MNWAVKFAQAQREGNRQVAQQFRCDGCHCVEHAVPVKLCSQCGLDYHRMRDLVQALRRQIGRFELNMTDTVKTAYNRAIARVEELKGRRK